MKKILLGALCSVALSTALVAEDSGAFVGVSYQYSSAHFIQHFDATTTAGPAVLDKRVGDSDKIKAMNGAGLKLGYKQFFGQSKWFGLRYYAFLDYGYVNFGSDILPKEDYYSHMLSYGVGIDSLWNLYNTSSTSFGVFVGVGVGADTWIANGKDYQKENFPKGRASYANFQTTIDAGIRANFAKHHGFEVGVKVPLLQDRIFKDTDDKIHPKQAPMATTTSNIKTDTDRRYAIYVSYLYTF